MTKMKRALGCLKARFWHGQLKAKMQGTDDELPATVDTNRAGSVVDYKTSKIPLPETRSKRQTLIDRKVHPRVNREVNVPSSNQ